jgi:hypothetical protein
MASRPALRFWIECALGALSAIVLVMTVATPDWIERIFGLEPDAGDGSTEWGWAISLALVTLALFADARRLRARSTTK